MGDDIKTIRVPRMNEDTTVLTAIATKVLVEATFHVVAWQQDGSEARHMREYESPMEWAKAIAHLAVNMEMASEASTDAERQAARALVWQQASSMGLEEPLKMHLTISAAMVAALYNDPPGDGEGVEIYDLDV